MKVELCLKNVRCDGKSCHNLAHVSLDNDGYKGNCCLCKTCFDKFVKEIKSFIKEQNKHNGDNKSE